MISNATAKLIQSLKHKKYRQKYDLFVVEGTKSIAPILQQKYLVIKEIWHTGKAVFDTYIQTPTIQEVDVLQLRKVTQLRSTPDAIALVHLPKTDFSTDHSEGPRIYLDDVQDPGNVGTIIRIADWYGVKSIIRSPGSADFYGSKVIQSSMGSIANVALSTMDKSDLLTQPFEIVATNMTGNSLWRPEHTENICLVIGHEGEGVSDEILAKAHIICSLQGAASRSADSLNAAISCGILCDRFFS